MPMSPQKSLVLQLNLLSQFFHHQLELPTIGSIILILIRNKIISTQYRHLLLLPVDLAWLQPAHLPGHGARVHRLGLAVLAGQTQELLQLVIFVCNVEVGEVSPDNCAAMVHEIMTVMTVDTHRSNMLRINFLDRFHDNIPELLAVEYLRRQHVPLAVSPPPAGPHEAPLGLHAGSRDVDCVKLDTSGPQHRDNGLLLSGNLYT